MQKADLVQDGLKELYEDNKTIVWNAIYLVLLLGYLAYLIYACFYDFNVSCLKNGKDQTSNFLFLWGTQFLVQKQRHHGQHIVKNKYLTNSSSFEGTNENFKRAWPRPLEP